MKSASSLLVISDLEFAHLLTPVKLTLLAFVCFGIDICCVYLSPGTIPSNWGADLPQLQYLDLSSNRLSGQPLDGTTLFQLQFLNMSNNPDIRGTLSPAIGNLTKLEYLAIANCSMIGSLPIQWANMASIKVIGKVLPTFINPASTLHALSKWNCLSVVVVTVYHAVSIHIHDTLVCVTLSHYGGSSCKLLAWNCKLCDTV